MADKNPQADALKESQAQTHRDNVAALARTENVRPTPSQEENDRAKLGISSLSELDSKEADGSPEVPAVAPTPAQAPLVPSKKG